MTTSSRIVVTSPHPELTAIFKQVATQFEVPALIIEAVLEDAVEQVRRVSSTHKLEVIISRGGTARLLRQAFAAPVITTEATRFEILQALWRARHLSARMAYFTYEHLRLDADELVVMEDILKCPVRQVLYENIGQLRDQVAMVRREGAEVVVGGGIMGVDFAQKAGMQGILVFSSPSAVREAFERAHDLISLRRRDQQQAQQVEAIIEQTFQGVIARDREDVITIFNPVAEQTFGVPREDILGMRSQDLSMRIPALSFLFGGKEVLDALYSYKQSKLVFNRTPISVDGDPCGSVVTFQDVTKIQSLEERIRKELHRKGLIAKFGFDDIVYESEAMGQALVKAKRYAASDSTVLVLGESGTGKELVAQSIHNASTRRSGPFVAVNCAALPESLLESELFGYEEGAFTGARKGGKAGLFELAHKGTIFLDEIGKMPLNLQGRLLRILQEREVMRVGGDRVIPVDLRVLAATNKDLAEEMAAGNFRDDLYFRLNVLTLRIPALRERKNDTPMLVQHFLKSHRPQDGSREFVMPRHLMDLMIAYPWPGNVRELASVVEKYVTLQNLGMAEKELEQYLSAMNGLGEQSLLPSSAGADRIGVRLGTLEEMQQELIETLEARFEGNKTKMAKHLGVSRTTLWKKMSGKK